LEAEIKMAVDGITEPTIVLSLDKELTIQQLVDVLEIGNRLKIKMILATKAPNG
jgi:biopolymer transport protein ExbD